MRAEQLLAEIEARGVAVSLDREHLRLRPRSRLTQDLIEDVRAHKMELRGLIELRQWPKASREAVRHHRAAHARLFPFLDEQVRTPRGDGRLVGVFAERAEVRLAAGVSVFLPSEIWPPGVPVQAEDHFEAVH